MSEEQLIKIVLSITDRETLVILKLLLQLENYSKDERIGILSRLVEEFENRVNKENGVA